MSAPGRSSVIVTPAAESGPLFVAVNVYVAVVPVVDTVFVIDTFAAGVTVMDADAEVLSCPFGSGVLAD